MADRDIVKVLIYLPKYLNEDLEGNRQPVDPERFEETMKELAMTYEAAGTFHHNRTGFWWYAGKEWTDDIAILEMDILDTAENREWIRDYVRGRLLDRFAQHAIYLQFLKFPPASSIEEIRR